jgi:hypothetical protein
LKKAYNKPLHASDCFMTFIIVTFAGDVPNYFKMVDKNGREDCQVFLDVNKVIDHISHF